VIVDLRHQYKYSLHVDIYMFHSKNNYPKIALVLLLIIFGMSVLHILSGVCNMYNIAFKPKLFDNSG